MENFENFPKHETEYITQYLKKGYEGNFRYEDGGLVVQESDKTYKPEEIEVVAEHRFEGMSNPSDMSILYVIETNDNIKGTILCAYGPEGDSDLDNFMKAVPKENMSNKENVDFEDEEE